MGRSLRVSRHLRRGGAASGKAGFTVLEVIVAVSLLGLISVGVVGGLLFAIKEAGKGKARSGAASWVEAEVDFLRVQGFAGLSDDLGTRTLTKAPYTGYTTYGALQEPRIPNGFDRATVKVEDVGGVAQLRKITINLFDTTSATAFTTVSTFISAFTYGP